MKTIPLDKGLVALVDDEDFEFLSHWKWRSSNCKGYVYAKREEMVNGVRRSFFMHRVIIGAAKGQIVDHANRTTLDNQRHNLRKSTKSQNAANGKCHSHSMSGIKGVDFFKSKKKWRARIRKDGKTKSLGYFKTPQEASDAYDAAAVTMFGDFALTNRMMSEFK